MTCIVGLVHDGVVYMGGDSAGVTGYDIATRADEKVFTNGDFIMGFTTSFRMGQILRYSFDPPEQSVKKDDMKYLVTDFIDNVRNAFSDAGFLSKDDGVEEGGTFLFGYKGSLYQVDSDFQIGRPLDKFAAIGCGGQIAMGAMYASKNNPDPITRITQALEAAEAFSAGVRRPFIVLKFTPEEEDVE